MDSKPEPKTVVECPDGSIEIYESSKRKSQKLFTFLGIAVCSVAATVLAYSGEAPDLRRIAILIVPLAVISVLIVFVIGAPKGVQGSLAIKFTTEGVVAGMQSAKWVDVSDAYVKSEYECVLLSRRAGEVYLNTFFLDVTPQHLLAIVNRPPLRLDSQ